MTKSTLLSPDLKDKLHAFLVENDPVELVNTYLFYMQHRFNMKPVLYPKQKIIYLNADDALKAIEAEQPLWREAEIKISFSQEAVNEGTRKIYICPFTGKVFGDNTNPNPQDAIYDWVSKCPENTERVGGLRVKRFFVSDDLEVIRSYIGKSKSKEPITKKVYSAAMSGKIFATKEAVIEDFKTNYLRPMTLLEVQNQNRYQIEGRLLEFIQQQLVEDKVAGFLESLADHEEFVPYVEKWLS